MTTMTELALHGCRPVPVAHYLKALAVLRLVSEQADRGARGLWRNDVFVLQTHLTAFELVDFFVRRYLPTPIIAPWNGGSGFYFREGKTAEKDPVTGKLLKTGVRDQPTAATRIVDVLLASETPRLDAYRRSIRTARSVVSELRLSEAPKGDPKERLIQRLRGTLDDGLLDWLDCALVLTASGPAYPPLLGTGGTEGNLDFTSNLMQRLLDLFDPITGEPALASEAWLRAALFEEPSDGYVGSAIGQFLPGSAGGANAQSGFDGDPVVNPWDFVLMLEGAVFFAAAAVRRLESDPKGAFSYPFSVRPAGVGYGSASAADEKDARAEMWLPMWDVGASAREVRALLNEGRAQVGGRPARNGVDFARALASLGVDRGLTQFQRYGFQVRNGLSYFATPLSRFQVREVPRTGLLDEIDGWLQRFRSAARGKEAPSAAGRALRALEDAILDLCQWGDGPRLLAVLVGLGQCERTMARSFAWTSGQMLRPIPALSQQWLSGCADGSTELRLAAALASVTGRYAFPDGRERWLPLRCHLEPVVLERPTGGTRVKWTADNSRDVVDTGGALSHTLNAILERRCLRAVASGHECYRDRGLVCAQSADVAAFVEGRVDEVRMRDLLWGCVLLDWPAFERSPMPAPRGSAVWPGALYGLTKLCFAGRDVCDTTVPIVSQVHRLAAAGDGPAASRQASRRLRASGLAPAASRVHIQGEPARRAAAALLFPIGSRDLGDLARRVLRPSESSQTNNRGPEPPEQGAAQ